MLALLVLIHNIGKGQIGLSPECMRSAPGTCRCTVPGLVGEILESLRFGPEGTGFGGAKGVIHPGT